MANKLEIALRKAGRLLSDHQVAKLYKIPEEMQQTPVDFIGHDANGRIIMVEAKMVKRMSLPVGQSPGLLPHQWDALKSCHRAGGLALIAWMRSGDEAQCKMFHFHAAEKASLDRKSINWYDIDNCYTKSMIGLGYELELFRGFLL